MKKLYWLHYNNYYNRILKVGDTLSDYLGVDNANFIHMQEDANLWNPNDGISTTVKAGGANNNADFSREPDYFIAVGENNQIDSRWFVIENKRIRKGQYSCVLKRDVFADDLHNFKQATCNIRRGLLLKSDTLIYNTENLNVNQILTAERYVKDKVGCPWLILYAASNMDSTTGSAILNDYYDIQWTGKTIEGWISANEMDYTPDDEQNIQVTFNYENHYNQYSALQYIEEGPLKSADPFQPAYSYSSNYEMNPYLKSFVDTPTIVSLVRTDYSIKTKAQGEAAVQSGKRVKWTDNNNVDHIAVVTKIETTGNEIDVRLASTGDLYDQLRNTRYAHSDLVYLSGDSPDNYGVYAQVNHITYTYEMIDTHSVSYSFNDQGYMPNDAPYFIFAIPYGDITIQYNGTDYQCSKDIGLAVANRMLLQNTADKVYDCQILPFCPLPDEFISATGKLIIPADGDLTSDTTIYHTDGGNNIPDSFIFNLQNASFTKRCMLSSPITIADPKMENTTDVYRLYSPNYASSFEFSAAKNNGIAGFNVRCTYMPHNPYIRIAPIWGGIYGSSIYEEDVRGLVCSGDYSLPRVTDAWVQYQEQNKNYEQIFNRQISNMDVMHSYDRIERITGAITGAIGAGSVGAISSPVMGIIGGTGSAIAGAADIALGELRYSEQKEYARDMHKLQLGNVQAMPRTLSRTTAFTIDNRYFPVFAKYSCSYNEKQVISNYFIENSFRVDGIAKPAEFMSREYYIENAPGKRCRGYLSGQIIKIDTDKDTHYINELNSEFVKGVYMR